MAEKALHDGREITIGVPGKLLYLRATQAGLVQPLPGSTDLAAGAHRLYYRFPWPDEDGTPPGAYQPGGRELTLRIRDGLTTVHCRSENGVHHLRYQAWYGRALVPVLQCDWCAGYWCPVTPERAQPVTDAISALADAASRDGNSEDAALLRSAAARITAGYTDPAAACPVMLTRREVAAMFGVTSEAVARWERGGLLHGEHGADGKIRYPQAEAEALHRNGRGGANARFSAGGGQP